ncbi:MAG: lipoprotein signal peptidase [Bacteroidales bacterium]|nr:lipoprotein signal peptidase [Bacteroidales bacterium]
MRLKKPLLIIFFILLFDQALKFWIKTNMYLGQEYHVFGNWFIIHFTENEGMAFGMSFGGEFGKLILSLFRIVAITAIGWYLVHLSRNSTRPGLVYSVALIFTGALGNLIDSAFYGLIFTDSYARVAEFLPAGGGYASFLHGKVVDMFYFPLFTTVLPGWLPLWGGEEFQFFRPVFNIADASISVGVVWLILFQRRYFGTEPKVAQIQETEA